MRHGQTVKTSVQSHYTDMVVHALSLSGLFLESTIGITAALNLLVHSVAERNPEERKPASTIGRPGRVA